MDGPLPHPPADAIAVADVLGALADPTRLAIVTELATVGEESCGLLTLGLTKATTSHHLRILREAGVTMTRIDGRHRRVSLRRADLDARFPGLLDAVLGAADPAATLAAAP